jgi:S1-C subfamily serine protease
MNEFDIPPVRGDADRDPGGGRSRRLRHRTTIVVGLALVAVAASLITMYSVHLSGPSAARAGTRASTGASFDVVQSSRPGPPASTAAITARVDPGLVNINVGNGSTGARGQATGMVLTSSGVVLTNNHVVRGATRISATDVGDGRTYAASVVGYDRSADVAVIQLKGASGLQTVPLGDSSTVAVADRVLALGNAGGGGGTPRVAKGQVTALRQSITASDIGGLNAERLHGLIGTNAAVRPGDSGGPLVNDAGQVIGMDAAASAGASPYVAQPSGPQGFAIPIDAALAIARQIEAGTSSATVHVGPTGFLGVEVVPSARFGGGLANAAGSSSHGALVAGALPGYPAARIGLKQGDIIMAVDGRSVASAAKLTDLLSAHHPGDSVQLRWTDPSGRTHNASVTLVSGPAA